MGSLLRRNDSECRQVEFESDELNCLNGTCTLRGNARLRCDDLTLWADSIELTLDEGERFSGAKARGNVIAVDGATVLRCEEVTLEGDRIRGQIAGANVELKTRSASLERIEAVRNRMELSGSIEKTGDRTFVLEDAELTLCDCGDEPASWLLRSARVEADVDNRAELYWSLLWLQPFGLVEMPLPLPIPYLSIPFDRRAPGFLPPDLQFFGVRPLVDLPFFIPLGDSYDLTVTPGFRTDFITERANTLDRIGANRLGLRFRYAPVEDTAGEITVQYQRDARGQAVRRRSSMERLRVNMFCAAFDAR